MRFLLSIARYQLKLGLNLKRLQPNCFGLRYNLIMARCRIARKQLKGGINAKPRPLVAKILKL